MKFSFLSLPQPGRKDAEVSWKLAWWWEVFRLTRRFGPRRFSKKTRTPGRMEESYPKESSTDKKGNIRVERFQGAGPQFYSWGASPLKPPWPRLTFYRRRRVGGGGKGIVGTTSRRSFGLFWREKKISSFIFGRNVTRVKIVP